MRAEVDGCGVPALGPSGLLPVGRHRCLPDEVERTFVKGPDFLESSSRVGIWADVVAVVELIRKRRVRVPAIFLGGSFTSSVLNPGDADVSVIIDATRISSPATWGAVEKVARETKSVGLQVDAFLVPWCPEGDQYQVLAYLTERGKWDDFWQRHVPKADRLPAQRHHAFPARGYLEVIFDGYR